MNYELFVIAGLTRNLLIILGIPRQARDDKFIIIHNYFIVLSCVFNEGFAMLSLMSVSAWIFFIL